MITILQPQKQIMKLWGKQGVNESGTYRLMRYVVRVNHEDNALLHNLVTGELVLLDKHEAAVLETLPATYAATMFDLVAEHFLVPENCDEHRQVLGLRSVLRRLFEAQTPKGVITHHTILPTTACNARCYYCFEQGCKFVTMTEKTANDVVAFITSHCGSDRTVRLSWFGGEPTVAAHRIDQICKGLKDENIHYSSDITTNGYLFDQEMVDRAKKLWHLKSSMICVDGTERTYNDIKAYVGVKGSAYQRVMNNIGLLLDNGISVHLRMNFDLDNYQEFGDLVKEAGCRFGSSALFKLTAHPIAGEHVNNHGALSHATDDWFDRKIVELNNLSREAKLLAPGGVQLAKCLAFTGCQASNDFAATITADGMLVSCPEQFGDDRVIGNVIDGIANEKLVQSWKEFSDSEECATCTFFPHCQKLSNCSAANRCTYRSEMLYNEKTSVRLAFETRI